MQVWTKNVRAVQSLRDCDGKVSPCRYSAPAVGRGVDVVVISDRPATAQRLRRIFAERGPVVRRESSQLAEAAPQGHLPDAPGRRVLQGGARLGQCERVQMPRRCRATHRAHRAPERALIDRKVGADVRDVSRLVEAAFEPFFDFVRPQGFRAALSSVRKLSLPLGRR